MYPYIIRFARARRQRLAGTTTAKTKSAATEDAEEEHKIKIAHGRHMD